MSKQLLHLVLGGELKDPNATELADLARSMSSASIPSYAEAYKAWRAKAQATIDNAHMRYFVVHLHRLLDPEHDPARTRRPSPARSRAGASALGSIAARCCGQRLAAISAAASAASAGAVWMP